MNPRFSPSCDHSCVKMADRFASWRYSLRNKLGDWMIKQLLNLVIAKYHDLSVSCRSIICLSLPLRKIIDLLATDKSQYFAQPHPIIANCSPLKKLFCLNRQCFQLYGIFVGMLAVASGDKFWTWFLFSRCIWYLALNMCLLETACNKLCPILNSTLSFSLNYPDYQQPVRHHKTCPQGQQDHFWETAYLPLP